MVFFKKKKQSRSTTDRNSSAFENAFEKRLGQDPASYVESKLQEDPMLGQFVNCLTF